jgi:hypothetical protein
MKTAADFGESNIPELFVKSAIMPEEPMALYWRELAEGNKTIEIWSTQETKYVIVEGDFSDGEWGQQDVTLVDTQEKLTDAIEQVRASYILVDGGSTEENNVDSSEEDQQQAPVAAQVKSRLRRQGS